MSRAPHAALSPRTRPTAHGRYYQAPQMSLALVGPQRLDELQRLVERSFSSVPGRVLPPATCG